MLNYFVITRKVGTEKKGLTTTTPKVLTTELPQSLHLPSVFVAEDAKINRYI